MKQFFRDISPRRALRDFLDVWRGENRHRWLVLAAAVALTGSLLALYLPGGGRAPPEQPEMTTKRLIRSRQTGSDRRRRFSRP